MKILSFLFLIASSVAVAQPAPVQPRTVTIKQGTSGAAAQVTLDGTKPFNFTPTQNNRVTVTQGATTKEFPNSNDITIHFAGSWPKCPTRPADVSEPRTCPAGTEGSWKQSHGWLSAPYPTCWTATAWQPLAPPAGACVPVAVCPPQPPAETRPGTCPVNTHGNWTQTRTYTAATPQIPPDQCWVAGAWLPASPPAGACVPDTPPPMGNLQYDLSFVNQASPEFARFKSFVDAAVANPNNPPYDFKAYDAAMMFRITGGAQYQSLAIFLADKQVTTAEAAIAAAGRPAIAGDSYLEVGPYLAEIATVYAWCPAVTSAMKTRWVAYANQAVFNVWNPDSATWGGRPFPWSGWSINNPINNYYYSFMKASMLWGLAANDPKIIHDGKTLLQYVTTDRLPFLVSTFARIAGGGSLEGTGYGTAHKNLFELYKWWKDSGGTDVANASTHMTNTINTWVYGTVPGFGFFHPTGDQSRDASAAMYDYQRILMLWAVNQTDNAAVKSIGSWWLGNIPIQVMNGFNSFYNMLPEGTGSAPAALTYRAPQTGFTYSRYPGWAANATWIGLVFGEYSESHAHKEQGGITLWKNGWLAVTENIYSHSGIVQGDEFNNVVRFERSGAIQRQRERPQSVVNVTGYSTGPNGELHITGNISPVYDSASGVGWIRTVDFVNGVTTVTDNLALTGGTVGIWQLQVPTQPLITGNVVTAGALRMQVIDPPAAQITATRVASGEDTTFDQGWRVEVRGAATYRVTLEAN